MTIAIVVYVVSLVGITATTALASVLPQAKINEIAHSPSWLRIGHWRSVDEQYVSEIDNLDFFIASDGRTNPRRELLATIRAMQVKSAIDPNQSAVCQYPARYNLIRELLPEIATSLADQAQCFYWDFFRNAMRIQGISVVFSAYYIQNPASAFGHTFLKLHREPFAGAPRHDPLNVGIDYAPDVGSDPAFLFAIKGLAGSYTGRFKALPYYYKVREYNDYEARDLWEYRVKITQPQMDRLVQHLYELTRAEFDYYFLTENCSYTILTLLEAAIPDLAITDKLKQPIIPADTVAILDSLGFVSGKTFRPSLRRQFETRVESSPPGSLDAIKSLAQKPEQQLAYSVTDQAVIIDAASDWIDLNYRDEVLTGSGHPIAITRNTLLLRRASLGITSDTLQIGIVEDESPAIAHGYPKLTVAGGYDWGGSLQGPYAQLGFRLVLHDLLDRQLGFPDIFDVNWLQGNLRVYQVDTPNSLTLVDEQWALRVHSFDFLSLHALIPITQYLWNVSYGVTVGARRINDQRCSDCTAGYGDFTFGLSWLPKRQLIYIQSIVRIYGADGMAGLINSAIRAEVGAATTFRLRLAPKLLWLNQIRAMAAPWQQRNFELEMDSSMRWHLSRNASLGFNVTSRLIDQIVDSNLEFGWAF